MMKKRNIAVAMAAVTVASTVAPAFATSDSTNQETYIVSNNKKNELVSKIKELLSEKFAGTNKNVYTIKVSYDGIKNNDPYRFKDVTITNATQLNNILLNDDNSNIILNITDNGHININGQNQGKAIPTYDTTESIKQATEILDKTDGIFAEFNEDENIMNIKIGKNHSEPNNNSLFKKVFKVMEDIKIDDEKIKLSNVEVIYNDAKSSISDVLKKIDKIAEDNILKLYYLNQVEESNIQRLKDVLDILTEIDNLQVDFDDENLELTNEEKAIIKNIVDKDINGISKLGKLIEETSNILTSENKNDKYNKLTKKVNEMKELLFIDKDNDELEMGDKVLPLQYLCATKEFEKIEGFVREDAEDLPDENYEVILSDFEVEEETVEAETLFNGTMLTDQGKELIDILTNGLKIDDDIFKVQAEGKYEIKKNKNDEFELVMNFIGTKNNQRNSDSSEKIRFQVTVISDDKEELENIKNIFTVDKSGNVAGYPIDSIIGARRTETAVKISKENFEPSAKDGNVVLVGANAVVDGLAAGPLAKKLEAPVLLTNADSLDTKVEDEIKRLLVDKTMVGNLKTQTVYIVGGEAVVSENVVEQLENLGIKVERLAGDRRDTTSLAVAEKMDDLGATFEKAFVVGANGEADAMSIAAHAAKIEAPIIVNGLDGTLSKEAKKLIKDKQIDIIGGETVVSKELAEELKDIDKDGKITRVQGSNREETNANVIKKYYSSIERVYIAKDGKVEGNDKLVDALAISPVAADKGVVVLATNDLTKEQKEALELKASNAKRLTQVGGGVSETVVTKVAKLLSFIK